MLLNIKNLSVRIEKKEILSGLNLQIKKGEVHAIMGRNGSGKSTLAQVLAGKEGFEVTEGQIEFEGQDLLAMAPEERARKGLFLGFQYPVEIAGMSNVYLLRAAFNARRKYQDEPELNSVDFLKLVKEKLKQLNMKDSFLSRGVNEGFSGGEKKQNEMLQCSLLEPKLAILDEIDSGLDIDSLKTVAEGINQLKNKDRSIILVTHYQRLLNYIIPDYVHILSQGKMIKSGDQSLALSLEKEGYERVLS